ncbi:hypothetical protein [Dyadobacter sp. CY323]|uniref:hypothetical protein n=1 Tax=Dyadobacter sp. CY323 TaxID=2907302 RepID=UPI001F3394FB|nr:hypothetical protein [Dyadobacter sp. CY323]MCE6988990.1 hypothetical protein [Dyadobacter sp. CY323]
MNFKIITLPETQTEICLHREFTENGEEIVRITTFVINSAGTELMLERVAKFSNIESAKCFLQDYSETSANAFLSQCLEEDEILVR